MLALKSNHQYAPNMVVGWSHGRTPGGGGGEVLGKAYKKNKKLSSPLWSVHRLTLDKYSDNLKKPKNTGILVSSNLG